ncbi:MAG TPA: GNAT family N-acetyltransferase [Myxococcaceae bacterium]|nr:GNAT family N-acetyltransferase [Myxococcaceae bacterium]
MARASERRQVVIKPVENEGELLQALAIREVVFIEEQHVPEGFERDADDSRAYHVLAMEGGHAIGTGRLVMLSKPPKDETGPWAQISRMAVLSAYRGTGVGALVLQALEEQARQSGAAGIILHAQLTSLDFYKAHEYQPVGAAFQEAGMPHLEMHKRWSSGL